MKKKFPKITYVITFGILVYFFVFINWSTIWYSGFPKANKFQMRFNSQRLKSGVLPIPSNWVTHDKDKEIKIWTPPKDISRSNGAYRFMKIVEVQDGQIIHDKDKIGYLQNKSKFFKFVIETDYNYKSKRFTTSLIEYYDNGTKNIKPLNIQQRDSILKSWNFNYPEQLKNISG